MQCPKCEDKDLHSVLTDVGVEIDACPACKGVWLDRGEIFYFVKDPGELENELERLVEKGMPSKRRCPRTGKDMVEIQLSEGRIVLDASPASGGLWFDGGELERLSARSGERLRVRVDPRTAPSQGAPPPRPAPVPALPNLFLRSTSVLVFLYGLVTLILITLTLYTGLTPLAALVIGVVIVAIQFLLGPFFTDLVLRWLYSMSWVTYAELPAFLREFVNRTCSRNKMKPPRIGIIRDGAPNAFTYGHTPNNARIIFTWGLLDLLNQDEVEAVAAHEIGHAKHWDMLIMTAAQLIPLVLYYVYRTLLSMRGDRDDKSAAPRMAIVVTSYILYIISEYAVLWLSRTREYFADRFAGETTGDPNALARGLVKIGYGLAGKGSDREKTKEEDRRPGLEAVGALGIFDPKSSVAMAVSSLRSASAAQKMGDEVDKENLKGAMKWDLWNPWANYYELHSTHPLIANRINHLSRLSEALGKKPFIRFDERRPESYWDEFFVDLLVQLLPGLSVIVFLAGYIATRHPSWIGVCIFTAGIASLIKTHITYRSPAFPGMAIASLLKKVKVSAVRPVPCRVRGTVIGRGIPGLIWSEDFVMQDDTGIIFLDYHQPIPLWNFFFGLLSRGGYDGREVEVVGWYRRNPVPYIEIMSLQARGEKARTCYTYLGKYLFAGLLVVIGLVVMFTQ